jgi:uncharacterized protein YukE
MSFEGMDVDQLRRLAAQINGDAQTLSGLIATMTGVTARLALIWHGPVSVAFEEDWQSKYRPELLAAASILSDLHTHLVNNISQQTSASAAESYGAPGLGAVVLGGIAKAWDTVGTVQEWAVIPEYLIGKEEKLFGHTGDPDVPRLEDAKAVRWLHDTPALRDADDVLVKTHAYKVLDKVVEPVNLGIAVASVGVDLGVAYHDAAGGNAFGAANHVVDAEADALGAVPVVGPLADFDTELAKNDVDEIVTGGPIPSPGSWQNLREDYFPLPGEMWRQLLQDKGELLGMALGGHGSDG